MPRPLELTTVMPDCGEKIHATLVEDSDGYVIRTKNWRLHVNRDMSVRSALSAMNVAHILTEHRA